MIFYNPRDILSSQILDQGQGARLGGLPQSTGCAILAWPLKKRQIPFSKAETVKNSELMTGVILSGGKNTRMGTNKAFLEVGGERLIDRSARVFRDLFAELIIVTNSPLDYLDQDATLVTDVYPGKGALGGIFSGLFFASTPRIFVAACDMPYLDVDFIRHMKDCADDFDIVVPRAPDGLQPLHAIYSQRCLEPIRRSLEKERLKITSFYKGLRVREIPPETVSIFDSRGRMFLNVNSKKELALLQA